MRTIIISLFESPIRRCYSAKSAKAAFATKHEHAHTPLGRFILPALAFGLLYAGAVQAQVGSAISADGSAPNDNAMLDVQSPATGAGKGLLIPRVTGNQRTNANASLAGGLLDNSGDLRGGAAQGLMVYQTDGSQGLYFNTSQTAVPSWVFLGEGADMNMLGHIITNAIYYGDGRGITNLNAGVFTETDPRWASASNAIVADIAGRLVSNVWAAAGSTTNYLPRTGGTMSGALNMGAQDITNVAHIDVSGDVSVGRGANGYLYGTAVGELANGVDYGAALGLLANGYGNGAALGYGATGIGNGAALGYLANGSSQGAAVGRQANGYSYGVALGYAAIGTNSGVAMGYQANGVVTGVAVGASANGAFIGAALGLLANGSSQGAAVGRQANGYSYGAAVGRDANGYSFGAAVGNQANGSDYGAAAGYQANGTNYGAAVGRQANGYSLGAAVGAYANASSLGAALGYAANGSDSSAAMGYTANGATDGAALGYVANGAISGAAVGRDANGFLDGAAVGRAANGIYAGAALGYSANGSNSGVAVGFEANGAVSGAAMGYTANGARTNVAIGAQASAQGGTQRIAIGNNVTNQLNNTAAIRGHLYLDGGTGMFYRATFGTGSWTAKAFEIAHPLDPENKILRHFCLESPQVWNVYAGNAQLVNGQAKVQLPDYYSALNLAGSEIYGLTPIGAALVWVDSEVADNCFTIAGKRDIKVSWTIKVLRNDPGCLEDLRRRPVEQRKSELETGN